MNPGQTSEGAMVSTISKAPCKKEPPVAANAQPAAHTLSNTQQKKLQDRENKKMSAEKQ